MDAPGSRDSKERLSPAMTAPSPAMREAALAARIAGSMLISTDQAGKMALLSLNQLFERGAGKK